MGADIINLRRARKAKDHAERGRKAAANRASYGRTKAEKQKQEADRKLGDRSVEGHRRTPPDER